MPRTRRLMRNSSHLGVPFISFALLGFAILATSAVIRLAPAFVEDLRVEGIAGLTRTEDTTAMYSYSEYLMQTGAGFVNADAFSFATIEAPDEIASFDVVLERASRGAELLERALTRDPSNAYIWFVYAQALAGTGRMEDALNALARSQDLSPTMTRLAYQRSWVFSALLNTLTDGTEYSVPNSAAILNYRSRYLDDWTTALDQYDEGELPPAPDA